MEAPGAGSDQGLHFMSNYDHGQSTGTGDVNVSFEHGRVTSVLATVDNPKGGPLTFVWSAYEAPPLGQEIDRSTADFRRAPYCSDLSGNPQTCAGDGSVDGQLTETQMEGNLSKSDLLQELKVVCQGANDPNDDCDRIRQLLQ
jgi:hypothetical protein